MPSAWSGSLRKLKDELKIGVLIENVIRGYEEVFKKVTTSEVDSWVESIPAFIIILNHF